MPIIEAIEAVQGDKPSNDEGLSNAIASSTKPPITYNLNHDGSVVLRTLAGISQKVLKRKSDEELKAIGLFKTLRGKDEKFFPTDKNLELQYQEKATESKYTRDRLKTLQINELRKTYRDTVPTGGRNSEKHTKAAYATRDFMIDAILKSETYT